MADLVPIGTERVRHPVLWLRHRDWFWPVALRRGFRWLNGVVDLPMFKWIDKVLGYLPILGVALVLHEHPELIGLVLVFVFMGVWAKGARLKWKEDRGLASPTPTGEGTAPVQLAPGPHELRGNLEEGLIVRPISDQEARRTKP